jgi:glutamate 5-kinase
MEMDNFLPYHRIVLKFGTSLLTNGGSDLDTGFISNLVNQIASLHKQGIEIIIVSSGAVAAGRSRLNIPHDVKNIPIKQVFAAVGQSRLMRIYEELFDFHNIIVAQALLTKSDISARAGYLNARNTLMGLLELNVIPIINENDVVAVDELREGRFGDNDNLSAMVANLVDADILVILSDIAGLYTADPRSHKDALLIPEVREITPEIELMASDTASKSGTGGMLTKLQAARLASSSGITTVITNGKEKDIIIRLVQGEPNGTKFLPLTSKRESRERWTLSGLGTRGKITLDDGAVKAVIIQNKSILAAGVVDIQGDFERGDIVDLLDRNGCKLGSGISNYNSNAMLKIKGLHSSEIARKLGYDYGPEIVHRNNLVLLREA